ncbi:alpha/beta-hydrolase [Trichoderma citrinoviride]|uniref:Alpha/beta-hydrolase n=1 Tax=Trichoderma citrinoviride TaxID=58853 RepID=A0A2T4BN54_9HYPO|nr:alpha/beta-hydrolase [Trichoderma citrinoviride]PTB70710.1 alpha/beta-hydrolase [Trichoderma citrinoviride]
MLRTQTVSAILQRSRLSFTLTTSPSPLPATTSSMSTTESAIRAHPPREAPEDLRQQRPQQVSGAYFPLGYKEAAYQWWCGVTPSMAERNVLKHIPFLKEATSSLASLSSTDTADPFGTRIWRQTMVPLSGKNRALNEFSVERVGEESDETLVMLHGYGAGLGFFYKNFEPITRIPGLKLYALDMLGMGNSSRPPFKIHAKDREGKVIEAENWFIDALEEWRKARKIERFTLLGHSLGGYLAVSYALKYPGHLKKLILASPVGIPEDPYAVNSALPEPGESTMQNEFTVDQQTTTTTKNGAAVPPKRPYPGWLVWLWDANVSPFSIVRMAGPLGPRFVSGWTSRRFNHLPAEEAQTLHDYSFSIFKQKGSGEYALGYILAPGAFARRPVINRIQDVGRQPIKGPNGEVVGKETGIPIVFMYGENDWMDVAGGLAAEEKLKQVKADIMRNGTEEEKANDKGSCKVVIIPKAGHHLYLDNAEFFNNIMRKEMEDVKEMEKRKRAESS